MMTIYKTKACRQLSSIVALLSNHELAMEMILRNLFQSAFAMIFEWLYQPKVNLVVSFITQEQSYLHLVGIISL